MGAKKNPYYRIVIADSKSPRDGRFIEEIGTYNPLTTPSEITIDKERADYWIKNGAQPTDTVRALLKKADAPKEDVKVSKAKTKEVKEEKEAKETVEEKASEAEASEVKEEPEVTEDE